MDLVRDLLDKKVVDRNGREVGRVDSIVLAVRDGQVPRVIAIEIGPAVLAARVWPALGRWVEGLEHALGVDAGRPTRIPFSAVLAVHDSVQVDMAFGELPASTIERRLRRWLSAIPEVRRASRPS
jgi:sporulation protein YlmC with PRC-barrel domain